MDALIFIALLALLIWGANYSKKTGDAARSTASDIYRWPALDRFAADIVGESHYQADLQRLVGPGEDHRDKRFTALLAPEKNPHDSLAVRVDIDNLTVGYLSREHARRFRKRLSQAGIGEQPTCCAARIAGGFRLANGLLASYGVKLDIEPLD